MKYLKYTLILCIAVVSFASCHSYKSRSSETTAEALNDTIRIKNDTLEYEIIIIEPGFFSWLKTQKPRGYYNQSYLENRNILYVTEYNQRVRNFQMYVPDLYTFEIDYNPNIDYGYEVNYMLYHYFIYFQQQYHQSFIGGRGY